MSVARFYGWRHFIPALIRGVSYNERQHPGFYRRWPLGIRFSWPRYGQRLSFGLHGIQCGSAIIRPPHGKYVTSARVYRTALRLGPVVILFGPERERLTGHPEDIAHYVFDLRKGEIVGLLNTHAYKDHVNPTTLRRDLRRVLEEVTH